MQPRPHSPMRAAPATPRISRAVGSTRRPHPGLRTRRRRSPRRCRTIRGATAPQRRRPTTPALQISRGAIRTVALGPTTATCSVRAASIARPVAPAARTTPANANRNPVGAMRAAGKQRTIAITLSIAARATRVRPVSTTPAAVRPTASSRRAPASSAGKPPTTAGKRSTAG